eukprot:1153931-Pelagomonas_calceolata.AAC.1
MVLRGGGPVAAAAAAAAAAAEGVPPHAPSTQAASGGEGCSGQPPVQAGWQQLGTAHDKGHLPVHCTVCRQAGGSLDLDRNGASCTKRLSGSIQRLVGAADNHKRIVEVQVWTVTFAESAIFVGMVSKPLLCKTVFNCAAAGDHSVGDGERLGVIGMSVCKKAPTPAGQPVSARASNH